jgi:hypothetical protein
VGEDAVVQANRKLLQFPVAEPVVDEAFQGRALHMRVVIALKK